jgi:hypothetical protein
MVYSHRSDTCDAGQERDHAHGSYGAGRVPRTLRRFFASPVGAAGTSRFSQVKCALKSGAMAVSVSATMAANSRSVISSSRLGLSSITNHEDSAKSRAKALTGTLAAAPVKVGRRREPPARGWSREVRGPSALAANMLAVLAVRGTRSATAPTGSDPGKSGSAENGALTIATRSPGSANCCSDRGRSLKSPWLAEAAALTDRPPNVRSCCCAYFPGWKLYLSAREAT